MTLLLEIFYLIKKLSKDFVDTLYNNLVWLTLSKALLKSRKTQQALNLQRLIFSVSKRRLEVGYLIEKLGRT